MAGVFIILFCLTIVCAAQGDTVLKPGTDTALIKKLCRVIEKCKNPDSVLLLFKEPLRMSIAGNYTDGAIHALQLSATAYYTKCDFTQYIATYRRLLSLPINQSNRSASYFFIANGYFYKDDFVHAAENFDSGLRALQIGHVDRPEAYIFAYNSLGTMNSRLEEDSNALYYFGMAEALARKGKFNALLVTVLMNKCHHFIYKKRLDSALNNVLEAKEIVEKNNLKNMVTNVDESLAHVYLDSGLYEKTVAFCKVAIDSSNLRYEANPSLMLMNSSSYIGAALYHLGKYKEAEAILVPALEKAKRLNIGMFVTSDYKILIGLFRATGQYKKALDYKDSLGVLSDSARRVENFNALNVLRIKYQTAEKDKELSQNQLLMAQQNNKIARKNIWMISIGSGLLLLLFASSGVYMQTRNRQKSLERDNKIGILKAAVAGGDNERSRIARELHDGIGGMLSAAMMRFSSMHHEKPEIADTAAYKDAMGILREMGDEIRKTAHNLMPEVLLKQSLPEAIRGFCNNVQEEGTLKIDFQSYGYLDGVSQGHKLNLYRITQELIKNATTHSGASHALVQLMQNENKLMVSVEDNGKGFNMQEIKGGLGLHNIRTRVSSMDGHFTLESQPGKGTTVIIELEISNMPTAGEIAV